MRTDGFTLIEVIVVMAIVAILAGIMVPFVYKVWEGNDIELTKERMLDLKRAMVGDPRMVQNGVRTHFGFAGDNAQLPRSAAHPKFPGEYTLSDDLVNTTLLNHVLYPFWNGPYLPAGFDPAKYNKDAWGNEFVYVLGPTDNARRVSAALKSAGPDRIFGNADDINDTTAPDLQVYDSEVVPTAVIQGNVNCTLNFVVATAPKIPPFSRTYSERILVTYRGPSGYVTDTGCCVNFSSQDVTDSSTRTYSTAFSCTMGERIPVGRALFRAQLFSSAGCAGALLSETDQVSVFVSNGLNAIYANMPGMSYTVNIP